ncbi:MAG: type II secretion system protein [Candidatus Omnitrophota bacterium]
MRNNRSFSLTELLITAAVGILVITGVLVTIIHSMALDSYNESFTVAMNIARAQLEEKFTQQSSNFDSIQTDATEQLTREANGLRGAYRIEVKDVISGQLKDVNVLVCWETRGRVWGEDCTCTQGEDHCQFEESSCPGSNPIRCQAPVNIATAISRR